MGTLALSVLMTFRPLARGVLLIATCSASAAIKHLPLATVMKLKYNRSRHTFPDPFVLSIVSANYQNKIIPCGVVRVQEISDETDEAQAPRQDNQFIFSAELRKEILLVLLKRYFGQS